MGEITILGVVVGFLVSFVASGVIWFVQHQWHKHVLKKKFGNLEGTYIGYEFKQHDKADWKEKGKYKWELEDKPN